MLAHLAVRHLDDSEMLTAVLNSATRHCGVVLRAVLATPADAPGRAAWVGPLVATAAASGDPKLIGQAILAALPPDGAEATPVHFDTLAALLDAQSRKGHTAGNEPRVARALEA